MRIARIRYEEQSRIRSTMVRGENVVVRKGDILDIRSRSEWIQARVLKVVPTLRGEYYVIERV